MKPTDCRFGRSLLETASRVLFRQQSKNKTDGANSRVPSVFVLVVKSSSVHRTKLPVVCSCQGGSRIRGLPCRRGRHRASAFAQAPTVRVPQARYLLRRHGKNVLFLQAPGRRLLAPVFIHTSPYCPVFFVRFVNRHTQSPSGDWLALLWGCIVSSGDARHQCVLSLRGAAPASSVSGKKRPKPPSIQDSELKPCSCFSFPASCPQAASMSLPRLRRMFTVTPLSSKNRPNCAILSVSAF